MKFLNNVLFRTTIINDYQEGETQSTWGTVAQVAAQSALAGLDIAIELAEEPPGPIPILEKLKMAKAAMLKKFTEMGYKQ